MPQFLQSRDNTLGSNSGTTRDEVEGAVKQMVALPTGPTAYAQASQFCGLDKLLTVFNEH
jgi:hypothetical protein